MKKNMLWGALLSLICTQVPAEVTQQPTQPITPNTVSAPPVTPTTPATQEIQQNQPQIQGQVQQPTQSTPQNQPGQQTPAAKPQATPVINCDYKIPEEMKTIDQSVVLTWAEKATVQAFDLDSTHLDDQMHKLQACFTDQGWVGFLSALEKSGNLAAIKTQKLMVSSQIEGQPQVTEAKDNQWKVTLPLQVVYQNNKEKVTQLLNVNITVGRKITGDLGIVQLIATPRVPTTHQTNNLTSPNTTTAPSTTTDINKSAPSTTPKNTPAFP